MTMDKEALEDLTLILPFKGRIPFVQRQLAYLEGLEFPGSILLLPAASEDRAPTLSLRDSLRLDIEISPADLSLDFSADSKDHSALRKKLNLRHRIEWAVSHVSSPYLALSSDDDFSRPSGLALAARFLDSHQDFSMCRGLSAALRVRSGLMRPQLSAKGYFADLRSRIEECPVEHQGAFERIQYFLRRRDIDDLWNQWYAVVRREAFGAVLDRLKPLDLDDFVMWEVGLQVGLLSIGKAGVVGEVSYVRQVGTSQLTRFLNLSSGLGDRLRNSSQQDAWFRDVLDQFVDESASIEQLEMVNSQWLDAHEAENARLNAVLPKIKEGRDALEFVWHRLSGQTTTPFFDITHRSPQSPVEAFRFWNDSDIEHAVCSS